MSSKRIRLTSLSICGLFIGLLVLVAALQTKSTTPLTPLSSQFVVTTTVSMLADTLRAVGKDHIQVQQLMGTGIDPHLYRPTRSDILMLMQSDLILYAGLHLEGQMAYTLEKMRENQIPAISVGDTLPRERLLTANKNEVDPHVWMDLQLWAEVPYIIADTLSSFIPSHKASFHANAADYHHHLQEVDEYIHRVTASIPAEQRIIITAHDAFQYFGRAYGFTVLGIQGISTDTESGVERINSLVDLIVEKKILAIFVESTVSPKYVRSLQEGSHARGHEVIIGGSLYSDSTGDPNTYKGTYLGMMDHNATTIVRSLGGTTPILGFRTSAIAQP